MKQYYVPLHQQHGVDLEGGQWVAPGERVSLSDEDALLPHNAEHLASGALAPVSEKGEEITSKADRATASRHDKVAGEEES